MERAAQRRLWSSIAMLVALSLASAPLAAETSRTTAQACDPASCNPLLGGTLPDGKTVKTASTPAQNPLAAAQTGGVPATPDPAVLPGAETFRHISRPQLGRLQVLRPPVDRLAISSRFGLRADPYDGQARYHHGLDIPGPAGAAIYASSGGRVTFAGRRGSFGLLIEIDHDGGIATRYAHLATLLVTDGMIVRPGQTIGLMGSTGRSTGNHLHFEVLQNGRQIDPLTSLNRTIAPLPRSRFRTEGSPATEIYRSSFAKKRDAAPTP
jgi:murein DD-endopeptidase MepM/ murein hydrolase activator NlpD